MLKLFLMVLLMSIDLSMIFSSRQNTARLPQLGKKISGLIEETAM